MDFEIDIEYALREIGYTGNFEPLYLRLVVLPPALTVSTNTLTFPVGTNSQNLTITNSGQGTLGWEFDPAVLLPDWLTVSRLLGSLTQGTSDVVLVTVDRTGLLPGSTETFPLRVISEDESTQLLQTVTVTLEN